MLKSTLFVCVAMTALAADNPWDKVCELKSGTEVRVYKRGGKPPVVAAMGDCADDRLIVVVKNEEIAIEKDEIDRLDYRPTKGSRSIKETKTVTTDSAQQTGVGPKPQGSASGPTTSTTSSYSIGSKPDFETLYRRPPPPPKKKGSEEK